MKSILTLSLILISLINLSHAGTGVEQGLRIACPFEKDVANNAKDLILFHKTLTSVGKFVALDVATRKPVTYAEDINSATNVFKAKQVSNTYLCVYDIEQTQTDNPNFHKTYRILLQLTL